MANKSHGIPYRTTLYWERLAKFTASQNSLFDIIADKEASQLAQGKQWGVMMTEDEIEFYKNQCKTPQIGHCEAFVNTRWKVSSQRKMKRNTRVRNEQDESYIAAEEELQVELGDIALDDNREPTGDAVIVPENKKKKYSFSDVVEHPDDDLPYQYRHIRSGPRSVKPEVYIAKSILQSEYHMSDHQSDGAILVVANHLFGRKNFGE